MTFEEVAKMLIEINEDEEDLRRIIRLNEEELDDGIIQSAIDALEGHGSYDYHLALKVLVGLLCEHGHLLVPFIIKGMRDDIRKRRAKAKSELLALTLKKEREESE